MSDSRLYQSMRPWSESRIHDKMTDADSATRAPKGIMQASDSPVSYVLLTGES